MISPQYYLQSLSHASYLGGDEESHRTALVDPQGDIAQYLKDLNSHHGSYDGGVLFERISIIHWGKPLRTKSLSEHCGSRRRL